ncbi:hypothetical protein GOV11_01940 [Candidatus Woesearchaeota archaeon]|nr:hypothetical protein [Candidatus Woesearchaeota archaeon]
MIERLYRMLSDNKLLSVYDSLGCWIGDGLSTAPILGTPLGFERKINRLSKLEQEVCRRKFKTLTIDEWISRGADGEEIPVGVRSDIPSELYVEEFIKNPNNGRIIGRSISENETIVVGTYERPTSRH